MPIQNPIQEHINEDKQRLRSQGWDIDRLINDMSAIGGAVGIPPFGDKGIFLLCKALLGVPQEAVLRIWVNDFHYTQSDFRPTISDTVNARLRLMYDLSRVYFARIPAYCISYLRSVIRIEIPGAMTTEKNQLVTLLGHTYPDKQVTVTQTSTHFVIYVIF